MAGGGRHRARLACASCCRALPPSPSAACSPRPAAALADTGLGAAHRVSLAAARRRDHGDRSDGDHDGARERGRDCRRPGGGTRSRIRPTRVTRCWCRTRSFGASTPGGAMVGEFALSQGSVCDNAPACGRRCARTAASSTSPSKSGRPPTAWLRLDAATGTELGRFGQTRSGRPRVRVRRWTSRRTARCTSSAGPRLTRATGSRFTARTASTSRTSIRRCRPTSTTRGMGRCGRLLRWTRARSVLAVTTVRCGSARRMRFDRFTAAGTPVGAAAGLPVAGLDDVEIRPGDGTIYASSESTASRCSTSTAASPVPATRCSGGSPSAATGAACGT